MRPVGPHRQAEPARISLIIRISQISVPILSRTLRDSTLMELIALIILICAPRWVTLWCEACQNQFDHKDQSDQCFHPAVYAVWIVH